MCSEGWDGERAVIHADAGAELMRLLGHSTCAEGGIRSLEEAAGVIGSLALLLDRLPQALDNLGSWLDEQAQAGRVAVQYGSYAGHPDAAVGVVVAYLKAVSEVLPQSRGGLEAAHTIAEALWPAGATFGE